MDGDFEVTSLCQWDGTWTNHPNTKTCQPAACGTPPTPPSDSDLVAAYSDGDLVAFDDYVRYDCRLGGKLEGGDGTVGTFLVQCKNDGTYDEPATDADWPTCKRTQECAVDPPAVPDNARVLRKLPKGTYHEI